VNGGIPSPFVTFGTYLLVPTLISLLLAYLVLRLVYRGEFRTRISTDGPEEVPAEPAAIDRPLAMLAKSSIAILLLLADLLLIPVQLSKV